MRRKPGETSVAVFSMSGIVAATMLKAKTNIDFVQVPYKAPSPAISDLLGGRVDALFNDVLNTVALVQSQKVRALAATSRTRSPCFPTFRPLIRSGCGLRMLSWGAAPYPEDASAMPRDLCGRCKPRHSPWLQLQLSSPDRLAGFLRTEIPKWSK